jgi:hypothetical protein
MRKNLIFEINDKQHTLGLKTWFMGVINVTPDSFSDPGSNLDKDRAVKRGLALEKQGADILDIGGESTRPGSDPVSARYHRAEEKNKYPYFCRYNQSESSRRGLGRRCRYRQRHQRFPFR